MKQNVILLFVVAFCVILFSRCKDDDPEPIVLDQAMLDNTNTLFKSVTGEQNGMDFPHNGTMNSSSTTIRDIFTANGSVGTIEPGTVVTKHTYANNGGNKGDLLVTFAMVKHQEGYRELTNDWEYVQMPFDAEVDYSINPNGLLAKAAISGNSFADEDAPGCVGCHNGAGGGDQLFSND